MKNGKKEEVKEVLADIIENRNALTRNISDLRDRIKKNRMSDEVYAGLVNTGLKSVFKLLSGYLLLKRIHLEMIGKKASGAASDILEECYDELKKLYQEAGVKSKEVLAFLKKIITRD